MCLIVFAYRYQPEIPLFVLANRDEFYQRPTLTLGRWSDRPLVGGRDLRSGGSWLAFGSHGRWAALTNARDRLLTPPGAPSRGGLVSDFVAGSLSPQVYAAGLHPQSYAGFNLLLGTPEQLIYVSDCLAPRALEPGLYGLSNAELDTAWPKLVEARETARKNLGQDLSAEAWLDRFARPGPGPGLDSIFVETPDYGTRCTTLALERNGALEIWERTYPGRGLHSFRLEDWRKTTL